MHSLGRWAPLTVAEAVALFDSVSFRWWLCGGLALERFVGHSWRAHDDVDVGLLRDDAPGLARHLAGWDVNVAAAGALSPWDGGVPAAERSENNLWCRRSPSEPWCLDLAISEGDVDRWIHRRYEGVEVPWAQAVLFDRGVPYLAPELQLSFKAHRPRPKDQLDAEEVIPHLDEAARGRLSALLDRRHPWQDLLG